MPMRVDCKHYESRTYASGETVRQCALDLAPEAPWRCPENCPAFERRMADAGWSPGSLTPGRTPEEPADLQAAAELLDAAEDIVNSAGPTIRVEVNRRRAAPPWWRRVLPLRALRRRA